MALERVRICHRGIWRLLKAGDKVSHCYAVLGKGGIWTLLKVGNKVPHYCAVLEWGCGRQVNEGT